tara:strand:+ start:6902 stop:7582 length:681 start_codon:yes stop_codon:yes gene_type:complete
MKNVIIKPFGVEIKFDMPENLAEMITAAGGGASGEAVVAELAHKQFLYHTAMGEIRSKVVEKIEETTGHKRTIFHKKSTVVTAENEGSGDDATVVYKDAKGKVVKDPVISYETENNFLKRICAEDGVEAEAYTNLIQEVTNNVKYDLTVRERTASEKKVAKIYLTTAGEIIANGALVAVAANLGKLLGRTLDVSDPDTAQEVLARAISDNEARERAASKDKYLAMA